MKLVQPNVSLADIESSLAADDPYLLGAKKMLAASETERKTARAIACSAILGLGFRRSPVTTEPDTKDSKHDATTASSRG
jgi:hypothetical protein